ncbi:hypothetical protein AB0M22_13525 [Nocardia sp. NPDC051756]|uniref:hypothetical protein n=1 Tax=Nocardia sp. NPDC051756 TaxID=3154751 RepID=UPI003424A923
MTYPTAQHQWSQQSQWWEQSPPQQPPSPQPQQPHAQQPEWPQPPSPQSQPPVRRHPQQPPQRTWDLVLTIVLYSGAAVLGMLAAYATVFFAFAADACGTNNCNDSYLGAAFIVSWGGTAIALVGSLIMIIVAGLKRWYMWYWPVLAALLIVGSFAGGVALASQVYATP